MKPFSLILSASLIMQSYNFNTIKNSQEPKEVLINTSLQIDYFTHWLDEIIGCLCYLSKNREKFEKPYYLVIDDYLSKALVKVNQQTETLKLVSINTLNLRKEHLKALINNHFELSITTIEDRSLKRNLCSGRQELKLTSKNKQSTEMKIFGHYDC